MPLLNIRALVTRPEPQASELAAAIMARQGHAGVMPMIQVDALPESQAMRDTILNLDRYQHIIVISRPAARIGLELLEQYWPQFPVNLQWFAIGKSTAAEMAESMINPRYPSQGVDTEAFLAMPELQHISDHKVLIIKGRGGRTLLQTTLQTQGAQVDTLEVYQRQRPNYANDELVKQLESQRINVILCGSGETVAHLGYYLPASHRTRYRVIVPSERVARHALALGFQQVHNANGASHHAMLSALNHLS